MGDVILADMKVKDFWTPAQLSPTQNRKNRHIVVTTIKYCEVFIPDNNNICALTFTLSGHFIVNSQVLTTMIQCTV